jgi:hypothetical protein
MANNRMILLCNVCVPEGKEWKYSDKGVLSIAKWHPQCSYAPIISKEVIDNFLEKHSHPEVPSEYYTAGAGQNNPVRLEYESIDKPILNILK